MKKQKITTHFSLRNSRRSESRLPLDLQSFFGDQEHENALHDEHPFKADYGMDIRTFEFSPVNTKEEALDTLRSLSLYMKDVAVEVHESHLQDKDLFSVLDMDGAQFGIRKKKNVHFLSPIRTRLEWQRGEYPVFRTEARYLNTKSLPFKDRRRGTRRVHISTIVNPANNEYVHMPHPEHEWPVKGQLYITNLQLLLRITKEQIYSIPFNMMLACHVYRNAVEIMYLDGNKKKTDLFFIEEDNINLLEIILQAIS